MPRSRLMPGDFAARCGDLEGIRCMGDAAASPAFQASSTVNS